MFVSWPACKHTGNDPVGAWRGRGTKTYEPNKDSNAEGRVEEPLLVAGSRVLGVDSRRG